MIGILLDETLSAYEQDIRELLMAFFPGEPFCYEKKPEAGLFVCGEKERISLLQEPAAQASFRPLFLTGDRKDDKTQLKRALYELLSELTGESLPWGTLTGIRPVKLAEQIRRAGASEEETRQMLTSRYLVSEEKAALSVEIAEREKQVLSRVNYEKGLSLYIGIPFCPTTCLYCSFTSYPIAKWENRLEEYLACLREELRQFERLKGRPLQTIYIGGGTPTALPADKLRKLLSIVSETLDLSSLLEYTVEAGRPDSLTLEKLRVLREFQVERISVNPQTMNQKTLDLIGRRHTVEDVKAAFCMAREAGFQNINMDLIMGLPEEGLEDVRHTLSEIEALGPDSLTIHVLAVKRAARLNTSGNAWAHLARAGKEEATRMTEMGALAAERMGLRPYYLYRQKNMAGNQENVGYAAPGKENLYNILMMEEKHTVIGCGAGASSKIVLNQPEAAGNKVSNGSWQRREPADAGAVQETAGLKGCYRVERFENIKNIAEYLPRFPELLQKKEAFLQKLWK